MIKVQQVNPIYVQQVWSQVLPWLEPVFKLSLIAEYYSVDNLKDYIIRGEQDLLIGVNEEVEIQAAVTVQWCNNPNNRIAYITAFGADIGKDIEVYTQFIEWLKAMGATRVECSVRPSVERLLKNKTGFSPSKQISMELAL